jgi:methylglutaconyl-CoA hydratase
VISPYVIAAIGERMARRYMLTGEEFGAAEAARMGLVHEVVAEDDLDTAIHRVLAQLHTSGPAAMAEIKALVPAAARLGTDEAVVDETARRLAAIRATPQAQEGLAAFLEKRPASWVAAPAGTSAPGKE